MSSLLRPCAHLSMNDRGAINRNVVGTSGSSHRGRLPWIPQTHQVCQPGGGRGKFVVYATTGAAIDATDNLIISVGIE
jgi:hypothetical protein